MILGRVNCPRYKVAGGLGPVMHTACKQEAFGFAANNQSKDVKNPWREKFLPGGKRSMLGNKYSHQAARRHLGCYQEAQVPAFVLAAVPVALAFGFAAVIVVRVLVRPTRLLVLIMVA